MFRYIFSCLVVGVLVARGDITITEFSANQPGRGLRWDAAGQPYAGAGEPWWSVGFDDSDWVSGATPIGYDSAGLATDISTAGDVTTSFYTRSVFPVTEATVNGGGEATLEIRCDDGFIVWLNGVEVGRYNMGAINSHFYFDQVVFREVDLSEMPVVINLGAVADSLLVGSNTLAVQVGNADLESGMLLEMSLSVGATEIVPEGSQVSYFPGLAEPGTGVFEPAAISEGSSDWIELHNSGGTSVNLGGWSLTDEQDTPDKWEFPAGTLIGAGEYLVILADNPPAPIAGASYLHAGFKLSSGGEYLGLYDASGGVMSEIAPEYPKQFQYYSYGVAPGGSMFGYLETPSPGQANTGSLFGGKTDAPDFEPKGGFFEQDVALTLSSETVGAEIRYTTDGTEPTLSNGTVYSSPIMLAKVSDESGHVIRARAFGDGFIASNTKTNTYLIDQDSGLVGAPALIYAGDLGRSLYKPFGILAIEGGSYPNSRWQASDSDDYNNAFNRGRAYEKPIHAEYYLADGSAGFRTDCGIRIAASSFSRPRMRLNDLDSSPWQSNPNQKPSFNLYFRDEYGNPEVSLPFNGPNASVDNFEQFRIRAGKNDIRNPFIIDELVRRMSRDMGQPASTGVINSLYVNGELKGFYNMVERLRTPFLRANHSSDPDAEWDVLQAEGNDNIASGDKVVWDEMIMRLGEATTVPNWEAVLEYADVANMADYFLLNIFCSTWDWPHNNWVAARERSDEGRYRLYVWDAEGAFGRNGRDVTTNMIDEFIVGTLAGSNSERGIEGEMRDLWNGLNRWEEFRIVFADRINKHLFNGGVLDDRGYEGSHIQVLHDELVEEFEGLLQGVLGESVIKTRASSWAVGTTRRSYLLGPNGESFRDKGLWPVVTPPELGQFGGSVSSGTPLGITNEVGDIYFTTDGTDPRLPGGAANPTATVQDGTTVAVDLIDRGADWRFNDEGIDLMTAWRAANFDDSAWSTGASPLGFGNIGNPALTLTSMNEARHPTAYLRSSFEIDNPAFITELTMSLLIDGGAVVYINGQETARPFMPEGVITFETTTDTDGDENNYGEYGLDASLLVAGTNTIAVEVHNRRNSSDMGFDLELDALKNVAETEPYVINSPVTVMARSFDGTNWSGLTTADFTVDSVAATSENLVIAEMLYNPVGPNSAELQEGVSDGDQFEFLSIQNVGEGAVDLQGVRFTNGISFDFGTSDVRALASGARAIIVSDLAAFRLRNGTAFDSLIAGEYGGKLNNGGETIRLIGAMEEALHDFRFDTSAQWPELGDLDGYSIKIVDPAVDHGNGSNWVASSQVGGSPRGGLTFAEWQVSEFNGMGDRAADADPDEDGLSNFVEFALGTPPQSSANGLPSPVGKVVTSGEDRYIALEFTRAAGERAVSYLLETSDNMIAWNRVVAVATPQVDEVAGTITTTLRDAFPVGERRFVRLRMLGR